MTGEKIRTFLEHCAAVFVITVGVLLVLGFTVAAIYAFYIMWFREWGLF